MMRKSFKLTIMDALSQSVISFFLHSASEMSNLLYEDRDHWIQNREVHNHLSALIQTW